MNQAPVPRPAEGDVIAPASSQAAAIAIATRMAPAAPLPDALLALLSGPLGDAVETAAAFAGDALAASTQRAYARDWRGFAAWCRRSARAACRRAWRPSPITALRDGIIAHPTLAEGLNILFSNLPP